MNCVRFCAKMERIQWNLLQDEERRIEELRRPTTSSQAKSERPWMKRYYVLDSSEKGRQSWTKMDLYLDCHKCMYTSNGTVKKSTKIWRCVSVKNDPYRTDKFHSSHNTSIWDLFPKFANERHISTQSDYIFYCRNVPIVNTCRQLQILWRTGFISILFIVLSKRVMPKFRAATRITHFMSQVASGFEVFPPKFARMLSTKNREATLFVSTSGIYCLLN